MTAKFDKMSSDFLGSLTRQQKLPLSAQLIASLSVRRGGLGIPDPSSVAIPTFILNLRRCIQYSMEGVWIGHNRKTVRLPSHMTDLYKDWETSNSKTFHIFNKYRMQI